MVLKWNCIGQLLCTVRIYWREPQRSVKKVGAFYFIWFYGGLHSPVNLYALKMFSQLYLFLVLLSAILLSPNINAQRNTFRLPDRQACLNSKLFWCPTRQCFSLPEVEIHHSNVYNTLSSCKTKINKGGCRLHSGQRTRHLGIELRICSLQNPFSWCFSGFLECDRYTYHMFCFSKVLKYFQHYFYCRPPEAVKKRAL